MVTPGFTPIDEQNVPGFTPVDEAAPVSAQPAAPKAYDPSKQTPGTATMGPREPSAWDRVRSAFPIIDRVESGISSLTGSPSNLEALAKPSPGMQTTQALQPENLMTPGQQQRHPIATGALEFAGGMTTPENALLTGLTAGPAPAAIARPIGGLFAAQMLRGAYQELPSLRDAADQKDWNEVERIGTHVVLGATMGMLGARQAIGGVSPYEQFAKDGREFAKVKQLSTTRQGIETNGVGLYNRVRDAILTHQEALKQQGGDYIKQAIEADNASQTIKGRGNISTTPAVNAFSDALTKGGGYDMKPQERSAFNAIAGKSELTLQEAKLLRTQFGRFAFERAGSPEFKSAATAAYDQLGQAMRDRIQEIYGTDKPYHLYNNRFKMAFELNDGVAGDMKGDLRGQDSQASIDPLKKFSKGNLKEITQQMRDTGNDQLATQLEKSQKDAKALTAAHDTLSGKFFSGAYRMLMQHPQQSWPGLVAMTAVHGIAPFPFPQIALMGVGAANMWRVAKSASGEIGTRLQSEMPAEKFQTRTQAMPGETFTPKNPDQGWGPEYGGSPRNLSPQGGGGANYSATDLEAFKAKHGVKDITSNPVGGPPAKGEPDVEMTRRRPPEKETTPQAKAETIKRIRNKGGTPDAPTAEIFARAKKTFEERTQEEDRMEKRRKIAQAKGVK